MILFKRNVCFAQDDGAGVGGGGGEEDDNPNPQDSQGQENPNGNSGDASNTNNNSNNSNTNNANGANETQNDDNGTESVLENIIGDKVWDGFEAGLSKESDPFGNIAKGFVSACKEKGISPNVAKELLKSVEAGSISNRENHLKMSKDACLKTLKDTWKDNYDGNISLMKKGYDKVFNDNGKALKLFREAGIGDNPLVCEIFRAVGAFFKEPLPANDTDFSADNKEETGYKDFLNRMTNF